MVLVETLVSVSLTGSRAPPAILNEVCERVGLHLSLTWPRCAVTVISVIPSSHTVASCEPVMPAGQSPPPIPGAANPTIFQLSGMTQAQKRLGQQFLASPGFGGASRTLP